MFTTKSEISFESLPKRESFEMPSESSSHSYSKTGRPKFEEFRKESKGSKDYGPFSEDTYYAMKDENETSTDSGKTKSKMEYSEESHHAIYSDKKSETYQESYHEPTSSDKRSPNILKRQAPTQDYSGQSSFSEFSKIESKLSHIEKLEKSEHSISEFKTYQKPFEQPIFTPPVVVKTKPAPLKHMQTSSEISSITEEIREPYKQPKLQDAMKMASSDKSTDIETLDFEPEEVFHEKVIPKIYEPKVTKIIPQPEKAPVHTLPKPELIKPTYYEEPKKEPSPRPSIPSGIGVESTKITKIADSSQYHQRFVTMQQTTRVIKFGDESKNQVYTKPPQDIPQETSSVKIEPILEPFPFKAESEKPRRDRGSAPPMPRKFHKGEFRESDYDSDYEGRIKVKWQPTDSDAEDEPCYARVRAPSISSQRSMSRERAPTPPILFERPPEVSGILRPSVEPIERLPSMPKEEVIPIIPKKTFKVKQAPVVVKCKSPPPTTDVPIPVIPQREESPDLPPPGTPPEEGIIIKKIEYVADTIDCQTRLAPLPLVKQETFEEKPYLEVSDKTIKTTIDNEIKEHISVRKDEQQIIKTTVTEVKDVHPIIEVIPEAQYKSMPDLEPFPFQPEPSKPKRSRGPPPPMPKKFVKCDMRESDYESDCEGRIRPIWQPTDSDAEEPSYNKIKLFPVSPKRPSVSQERIPTPPTQFDEPPPLSGVLRPNIEIDTTENITFEQDFTESKKEVVEIQQAPPTPVKVFKHKKPKDPKPEQTIAPKRSSPPLPEPGPQPEVGYIPPPKVVQQDDKEDISIKMIQKKVSGKKGLQIDIDITDIYDYTYDSESDRNMSDKKSSDSLSKPFPILEPFPFEPEPSKPKRQKIPPPPMPKKFTKAELRGSDYESDYEGKIPSRWAPPDSEGEEPSYRRVAIPFTKFARQRTESLERDPSPPSKFDVAPPQYDGPPRPVVDFDDLPRRERRESLEEYYIPKFPKIEFKPFDIPDDHDKTSPSSSYKTSSKKEYMQEKHTKETSSVETSYSQTTQHVEEQFEDMTQTFRDKAQRFAEQLVSEVFAGREGSEPIVEAGEPPSLPEELRAMTSSVESNVPPMATSKSLEALSEPQVYRDENRVSEYGTQHIDPDTGLIYFKYDFGYEFGVILPGEGKKVDPDKKSDDGVPFPIIHEKTNGTLQKETAEPPIKHELHVPGGTSPQHSNISDLSESSKEYKQYMGKMIPEFVPKKHAQFKPILSDPYSDSDLELDAGRIRSPPSKKDGQGPKRFAPFVPGATIPSQTRPGASS